MDSVHHLQRESGHGNHGCRPTCFASLMASSPRGRIAISPCRKHRKNRWPAARVHRAVLARIAPTRVVHRASASGGSGASGSLRPAFRVRDGQRDISSNATPTTHESAFARAAPYRVYRDMSPATSPLLPPTHTTSRFLLAAHTRLHM